MYFTGRLPHGGTPPIAPDGVTIPSWACRVIFVLYPPRASLLGIVKHALAALPIRTDDTTLFMSPEMSGGPVKCSAEGIPATRSNIAMDGRAIMSNKSLAKYLSRAALQLVHWILRQAPADMGLEVASSTFLSSVTYLEDGERRPVPPWVEAPNSDVRNAFGALHRDIQVAMLQTLFDHQRSGLLDSKLANPVRDRDIRARVFMNRVKGTIMSHCTSRSASDWLTLDASLVIVPKGRTPASKKSKLKTRHSKRLRGSTSDNNC